jgi:quinol monooxygenase YgiN
MNAVIVRYELDPSRLEEHVKLIDAVFAHLRDARPEGVHYGVMRSTEGTHFTHIGIYDSERAQAAASQNDAFQAFVADIGERCIVPPHAVTQEIVESYGIFGLD